MGNDYYEVGPLGLAHYWYDSTYRTWVVTRRELPKNGQKYGDQIDAALYESNRIAARKTAIEMVTNGVVA